MTTLISRLFHDDHGFIVSAELILVATIAVLGLVVGLSEVSFSVNNELEDVGSALGSVNQSFRVSGLHSSGKGRLSGSSFTDHADECDSEWSIRGTGAAAE